MNHPNRSKKRLTVSQLTVQPSFINEDGYPPTPGLEQVSKIVISALERGEKRATPNATLLAAAPEMLTTLQELQRLAEQSMTSSYDDWLAFHDTVARLARAAIAKATGETQS